MLRKNYTFEALDLVNNGHDRLLSNVTFLAAKLLDCPVAIVSVAQVNKGSHYISASYGLPDAGQEGRQVDFEQSVCMIVCAENRPLIVPDLLADSRTFDMQPSHHFGYRSYIGVPIHTISGTAIGSLCCLKDVPTEWDQNSIDLLQCLTVEVEDIIKSRASALELEATNAKLRKMLADRSSFSSHLTHEVRTPLTGLLGSIRLLSHMNLKGQVGDLVSILDRSSSRLLKVVNDTLEFAELDAGHFKIHEEPCNLGEIAIDILESHRTKADEKGVEVRVDDNLGGQIFMADKRAIISIMKKLFSNSVNFTEAGSAVMELNKGQYNLVEMKFIDTGVGIPYACQGKIFDEFQQADPSIARKYGGTGLGMAIVKRLVDEMHGDIELTSSVGKGTTITVWLPLAPRRPTPPPQAMPQGGSTGGPPALP